MGLAGLRERVHTLVHVGLSVCLGVCLAVPNATQTVKSNKSWWKHERKLGNLSNIYHCITFYHESIVLRQNIAKMIGILPINDFKNFLLGFYIGINMKAALRLCWTL